MLSYNPKLIQAIVDIQVTYPEVAVCIETLIDAHPNNEEIKSLIRRVAARTLIDIADHESVVLERGEIEADLKTETDRHKLAVDEITKRRNILGERCKHYLSKYHPDPAGGSDSHNSCPTCGKTW